MRATLSLRLELGRIVVESEDFEKPGQGDEQSASDPNHRHPGDLAVTGGNLVCEVASDAEQLGCFRDGQGGADAGDLILLLVVTRGTARSETPSERLCRDQLRVGRRVFTKPAGNSRGPLPVLGREELVERDLELLMEPFYGVIVPVCSLFG